MLHTNELKVKNLLRLLKSGGLESCSPTKHDLNLSYLILNVAMMIWKSKNWPLTLHIP